MAQCEYNVLGGQCSKKAVYVIKKDAFIEKNNNNIYVLEFRCSKHAEVEFPFTPLKRIDS